MKMNKLRIIGMLFIAALLFGCATSNARQAEESERERVRSLTNHITDYIENGERGANNLDGSHDVATTVIEGQAYLFVAAWDGNAVSVFRVADNGRLAFVDDIEDGERGANNLAGVHGVATTVIEGQTYLFVAAWGDSAVSVFSVADDGRLRFVDDVEDLERGANNLLGANSVATAAVGEQTYLFVGADRDSDDIKNKAVSVFSVANDGVLSFVDDIVDADRGSTNLEVETAVIGDRTYLFVSDLSDSMLTVFSVADNGILSFVDAIEDGERGANNLAGLIDLATVDIGDRTYLFVAALNDNAVSVFRVADDGILTFIDSYRHDGVSGVVTAVIDGRTYLFTAENEGQNAIITWDVSFDGRLRFIERNFFYENAGHLAAAIIGNQTYLFLASWRDDDGIGVFRVNSSDSNN